MTGRRKTAWWRPPSGYLRIDVFPRNSQRFPPATFVLGSANQGIVPPLRKCFWHQSNIVRYLIVKRSPEDAPQAPADLVILRIIPKIASLQVQENTSPYRRQPRPAVKPPSSLRSCTPWICFTPLLSHPRLTNRFKRSSPRPPILRKALKSGQAYH